MTHSFAPPSTRASAWRHHAARWARIAGMSVPGPLALLTTIGWLPAHYGAFIVALGLAQVGLPRLLRADARSCDRAGRLLLQKAYEDLIRAQELTRVGSWESDLVTGEVHWSQHMHRMLAVDPGETPGYELLLRYVHPDERDAVMAIVTRALAEHRTLDLEYRMLMPDGSELDIRSHTTFVFEDGRPVKIAGTIQDVTEQRGLEREIQHRAYHDPLTGLGNRAMFMDRITHALAVGARTQAPLTVLYLDLDDFKTVNDSMGHGAGDTLLMAVAERLLRTVRPGDTVARLGGDEFAILLENTAEPGAERTATRVLENLALPVTVQERSIAVRASIGVAAAQRPITAEEMLRNADIAMYAAKHAGKAGFRSFRPDMLASVVDRMALVEELRDALDGEQFTLHYQPIIDLTDGAVRGVEALARWEHPERGLVPPLDFIPLAEETGLIVPLGAWVLRTATHDVRAMQEALGQPLGLSVNVSAEQFRSGLGELVRDALTESELSPHDLTLEITESCLVDRDTALLDELAALRGTGVRIAIDDFGTGYSSMAYLRELPIDVLKIDRGFIEHVAEGGEQSALAEAIIGLGQTFRLETVAEGIETSEQAATLSGYGCHTGQGYLFSRPKPAEALVRDLRAAATTGLARVS